MTTPNKAQHTHEFTRSKPAATVETCSCGKFRFTENAEPAIVEQRAQHTPECESCGSILHLAGSAECKGTPRTQHTPGPWYQNGCAIRSLFGTVEKQLICRLYDGDEVPIEDVMANARLIAVAPELLEALKEIHKLWLCPEPKRMADWSARCDVMADKARAAIAKAEGRAA